MNRGTVKSIQWNISRFQVFFPDLLNIHPEYILLILFLLPVLLYLLKLNSGHVQTSRDLGAEALWKSQGVGDCASQATHSRTPFFHMFTAQDRIVANYTIEIFMQVYSR